MKFWTIYILAATLSICTYAQSQQLADSLRVLLEYQKSVKLKTGQKLPKLYDSTEANILYELSKVFWYSKPDTAIKFSIQSKEISEKIGYQKGLGFALYSIGVSYVFKPDLSLALKYTEQALSLAKSINNKNLMASAYLNTGVINSAKFNYPEAMGQYLTAAKIAESIGKQELIIWAYINLGNDHEQLQLHDESLKYYYAGLKIARESGDKDNEASLLNNIGLIYQNLHQLTKSNSFLFESLSIFEQSNDSWGTSRTSSNIGKNYLDIGNYDQAESFLHKALKISKDNNYRDNEASTLLILGQLEYRRNNYSKAIELYNLAVLILNEHKDIVLSEWANLYLYNVYHDLAVSPSSPKKLKMRYSILALQYHKLYIQCRDTIKYEENSKKILQINMQNEFEKKNLIVKLEFEKKQKVETLKKKITMLIAGLIILVVFIYIYFSKQKQNIEKKLLIERTKNIISMDLHDELGSNLSSISMQASVIKRKLSRKENVEEIVTNISTASQDMVSKMSDIVWSLQAENENTSHLIERISNYCAVTLPDNDIQFEIENNLEQSNIDIKSTVLKELYLITKEAINNGLKHAHGNIIKVVFALVDHNFIIQISDNGTGFNINQPGRSMGGNGLKNMKQRAQKIGAQIAINSEPNAGTTISITYPI